MGGYRLPLEAATSFFRRGYLWVDLFFILSGFIISYSGRAGRSEPFRRLEIKSFLASRFARIYPLHLFCLIYLILFRSAESFILPALGGTSGFHWTENNISSLIRQLFLLDVLDLGPPIAWNIPSWSISAELIVYMLFPLIVAANSYYPRLTKAALLGVSSSFYVYVGSTTGDLDYTSGLAILRCFAGFSVGMLIYYYHVSLDRLSDVELSILQVGSVGSIIAILMFDSNDVLSVVCFTVLVATTVSDRGILSALLSLRIFGFLGNISYSVYLNHTCVGAVLWFFWVRLEPFLDPHMSDFGQRGIQLVIWLGVILGVSVATYRYVEVPGRRLLVQRLIGERQENGRPAPDAP